MFEHPSAFVDLVIGVTLCEGLFLAWWHRRSRAGVAPGEYLPNMVSGLCLMMALRVVLVGGPGPSMLIWLTAAGLAHGTDLWRRWRRENAA